MPSCFVSVNESVIGGRAFIQSLYDLYASWGVDFVKHDCVFGADDLNVPEIMAVSQAITTTGRPMVYSLSPGVRAEPTMAKLINGLVNMYRVTGDDWDSWDAVHLHFDVARDFAAAGLIGAQGVLGLSWPDFDMLPLGYLTDPAANQGPHRSCQLTLDEQRTQVTLWAMAKSPLMFGGDMLNLDKATLDLITNPVMLSINAYSYGNKELQGSSSVLPVLRILECQNANSTRWSIRSSSIGDYDQLCWASSSFTNGSMELTADPMGCLNWNLSTVKSVGEFDTSSAARDQALFLGHGYILTSSNEEVCLDSWAAEVSNFDSFRSKHMAPCSFQRSQAWGLNHEGKLISDTTELCAAVTRFESGIDEDNLGGLLQNNTRVWTARGLSGEYYVAIFNLGSEPATISLPISSIVQGANGHLQDFFPYGSTLANYQCTGQEVWSSRDIGIVSESLSAQVSLHGCALFSLRCNQ